MQPLVYTLGVAESALDLAGTSVREARCPRVQHLRSPLRCMAPALAARTRSCTLGTLPALRHSQSCHTTAAEFSSYNRDLLAAKPEIFALWLFIEKNFAVPRG